jgi:hypothetical protein
MEQASKAEIFYNRQTLAPIEALPVEIIQEIFKRCWNLNLPLASLHISNKLANTHIYDQFCDLNFNYSVPFHIRIPQGFRNPKEAFERRWMTWSYFEQYLAKRIPSKACGCPIYLTCREEQEAEKSDRTGLNHDEADHTLPFYPSSRSTAPLEFRCQLPTKLTRGPWTNDKIKFIRCLFRISKMSVDWANIESVRIVAQGKREAIMERNLDAVHMFARARRLGKAPTLGLIKFAVIEGGCDRSIVVDLMTAAKEWGLRRWNDPELDAWVVQQEQKGNRKGSWLRVKLDEVRYGKMPDASSGDCEGEVIQVKMSPFRVS